jgi:hypothetical protein
MRMVAPKAKCETCDMKISKSDRAIRLHNKKYHKIPKKVAATAKERMTKFRAAEAKKRDDALKKKHV